MEIQDWLQMPSIPSGTVIAKNKDGSDITQDVDVQHLNASLLTQGNISSFFGGIH